jgi:hypothetical protein
MGFNSAFKGLKEVIQKIEQRKYEEKSKLKGSKAQIK